VPIVLKSGSLNLLEPSGPVQACNGIALLLFFISETESVYCAVRIVLPNIIQDNFRQQEVKVMDVRFIAYIILWIEHLKSESLDISQFLYVLWNNKFPDVD
jgi:hypothetical protein